MRTLLTGREGGLSIRTGRVVRDPRGREVGVAWDVDLSRLWDGVALWVALTWLEVWAEDIDGWDLRHLLARDRI